MKTHIWVLRFLKTLTAKKNISQTVALNTTYHAKIEVKGSTIKTYMNGELKDTTTDTTFTKGKVGFREGYTETAAFDNVLVNAIN